MTKKSIEQICFLWFFPLFLTPSYLSAVGESFDNPIAFQIGQGTVQISIDVAGKVVWVRANFGNPRNVSHAVFQTTGSHDTYMYFYKDISDARADKYLKYDDDSGEGRNAKITTSIGYPSPYYLKLRMYSTTATGVFHLSHDLYYEDPESCSGTGPCAMVAAAKGQTGAIETLFIMRNIKNVLLKKTQAGREIIDLYYAISRDLMWPLLADAEIRRQFFSLAKDLMPLMEEVLRVGLGKDTGMRFSEDLLLKANQLKDLLLEKISAENAERLMDSYERLDVPGNVGNTVRHILVEADYVPPEPTRWTLDKNLRYLATDSEIILKLRKAPPVTPTLTANRVDTGLPTVDKVFSSYEVADVSPIFPRIKKSDNGLERIFKIALGAKADPDQIIAELVTQSVVEYAERNKIFHLLSNDVYYPLQWALENSLHPDADIRASEAWSIEEGEPSVIVAVVDTGVDYYHADFKNRVMVDRGYDFVNNDNDPLDDQGHGTHVAGIIAAAKSNYFAIAGIAPRISIVPFKVISADGTGTADDVAAGIIDSVFANAQVINLSLGGDYSNVIEDAVRYAHQNGRMVTAAAGNDGVAELIFPASSQYTVAVGATDSENLRTYFSNFGEGLDIMAPGEDVVSIFLEGKTCYASGTSMSTPHVSGVAALLFSKKSSATLQEAKSYLLTTALDLGNPGYDSGFGWGLVDAFNALASTPSDLMVDFTWAPSSPTAGETVQFTDTSAGSPTSWEWDFNGDNNAHSTVQNPTHSFLPAGIHPVTLKACDAAGCGTKTRSLTIKLPVLAAPGATQLVSADNEFLGDRPTVVLIHGLQKRKFTRDGIWTCVQENCQFSRPAGRLIESKIGRGAANILQFLWEDAGQYNSWDIIFDEPYKAARSHVYSAGISLAKQLDEKLNAAEYRQPIHFIGHSLGSAVGAVAASRFLAKATEIDLAQFTALERPHHVSRFFGISDAEERIYGYDETFFASVLEPVIRPGLDLRIDNYYVDHQRLDRDLFDSFSGVGDKAAGPVYNHNTESGRGLLSPNDVGGRFFEDEATFLVFDNDHTGAHQWYRWTIDPAGLDPGNCVNGEFDPPWGFDESLDPCRKGWYWSVVDPESLSFPATNGEDMTITSAPLPLSDVRDFGCGDGGGGTFRCIGTASPFSTAAVTIPSDGSFFSFEFRFINSGAGDYAAVLVDDAPLWIIGGAAVTPGQWMESGLIPISGLTGVRALTVSLFGGKDAATEISIRKFRVVTAETADSCTTGTRLCLNQNRFIVEISWRDFQGNTGTGQVVPVRSDDSGLFWFFAEDNWEMLVKVLDGCAVNQKFWVFAAATTNVEYTLRVTDSATGTVKTYFNPLGNAAAAITDATAFATCSAKGSPAATPAGTAAALPQATTEVRSGAVVRKPAMRAEPAKSGSCTPSASSLCLNRGRFRVKVNWRDFQGNTGSAQVVPYGSDDSGLFWFFADANWEMLLKVLDGCSVNNKYWVFAAATTNVEYTVRVTDTATGGVKEYFNRLGNAAAAITDATAFATCP